MKKIVIGLVMIWLGIDFCSGQRIIEIYHGSGNATKVVSGIQEGKEASDGILLQKGQLVTFKIINANPLLYRYSFDTSAFNIDYNMPILSDFTSVFSSMNDVLAKAKANKNDNLIIKRIDNLKAGIDTVEKQLKDIKKIIARMDTPESIIEAQTVSNDAEYGLRSNLVRLREIDLLINHEVKCAELKEIVSNADEFEKKVLEGFIKILCTELKSIHDTYLKGELKSVISYKFIAENKPHKISLNIDQIEEQNGVRDVGKGLVGLDVIGYDRNVVELIPVISMIYSENVSEFGIKNGVITESELDEFSFKPGFLLAMNIFQFGKYKEFTLGPAIGYSIDTSEKLFQNFNIGVLFSFKRDIRFGFGWGMQQYRSALTDNSLLGNPLPQDMTINDVTKQVGKSSFMINISLVGLSLSKK